MEVVDARQQRASNPRATFEILIGLKANQNEPKRTKTNTEPSQNDSSDPERRSAVCYYLRVSVPEATLSVQTDQMRRRYRAEREAEKERERGQGRKATYGYVSIFKLLLISRQISGQ